MSSIEKMLEQHGLIELKTGKYTQTGDNCVLIANTIAEQLGYPSMNRHILRDGIDQSRLNKMFGGAPLPGDIPSDACFVLRRPQEPIPITDKNVHITFEHNGKEFNYGANFSIEGKLYVRK